MQRIYSLLSLAGILLLAGNVAWAQVEEPLGKLQTEGSALLTFDGQNSISQSRGTAVLLTNTDVKATDAQSAITLSNGDVVVLDQAAEVSFSGTADAPEVSLKDGVIAWYGESTSDTVLKLNGWTVTDEGPSAAICSVDSESKIVVQGIAGEFSLEKEGHETIELAPGDIVKLLPASGDDVEVVFLQDDPFVEDEVLADDEVLEEEDDDEGAYLTDEASGEEFLLFGFPGLYVVGGGIAAAGLATGAGIAIDNNIIDDGGSSSGGTQTTPRRRVVITPVVDEEPMEPMEPIEEFTR